MTKPFKVLIILNVFIYLFCVYGFKLLAVTENILFSDNKATLITDWHLKFTEVSFNHHGRQAPHTKAGIYFYSPVLVDFLWAH